MTLPVTSYVVFVYQGEVGTHTPHFPSMDEAEKFANDLRALTKLTISEPIPVIATEEVMIPSCLKDLGAVFSMCSN